MLDVHVYTRTRICTQDTVFAVRGCIFAGVWICIPRIVVCGPRIVVCRLRIVVAFPFPPGSTPVLDLAVKEVSFSKKAFSDALLLSLVEKFHVWRRAGAALHVVSIIKLITRLNWGKTFCEFVFFMARVQGENAKF